jgi:hypothetical protein
MTLSKSGSKKAREKNIVDQIGFLKNSATSLGQQTSVAGMNPGQHTPQPVRGTDETGPEHAPHSPPVAPGVPPANGGAGEGILHAGVAIPPSPEPDADDKVRRRERFRPKLQEWRTRGAWNDNLLDLFEEIDRKAREDERAKLERELEDGDMARLIAERAAIAERAKLAGRERVVEEATATLWANVHLPAAVAAAVAKVNAEWQLKMSEQAARMQSHFDELCESGANQYDIDLHEAVRKARVDALRFAWDNELNAVKIANEIKRLEREQPVADPPQSVATSEEGKGAPETIWLRPLYVSEPNAWRSSEDQPSRVPHHVQFWRADLYDQVKRERNELRSKLANEQRQLNAMEGSRSSAIHRAEAAEADVKRLNEDREALHAAMVKQTEYVKALESRGPVLSDYERLTVEHSKHGPGFVVGCPWCDNLRAAWASEVRR